MGNAPVCHSQSCKRSGSRISGRSMYSVPGPTALLVGEWETKRFFLYDSRVPIAGDETSILRVFEYTVQRYSYAGHRDICCTVQYHGDTGEAVDIVVFPGYILRSSRRRARICQSPRSKPCEMLAHTKSPLWPTGRTGGTGDHASRKMFDLYKARNAGHDVHTKSYLVPDGGFSSV